jgi:3-hydroxyisobutyrate dehydrogenase-like beta-hydroxyacid dehydrogenase
MPETDRHGNAFTPGPAVGSVGFIGLGIMGAPMAGNLIDAGFSVTVWNRTRSGCDPLVARGAAVAGSPQALAVAGLDVICVNVTDTPDVEAVLFGEGGVAGGAEPGLIVIDHSTISPVAAKGFAARLNKQGVTLLDAPVSGGDVGAQAGTLSVMVGGPAEAVERVMPVLKAVGKNIVHVGEAGAGQACKACNQVAVVCNLLGVCEAIALARECGLDVEKMIEVVGGGAGGSWQLSNLGPKIIKGDFAPGFAVDMVLKDLGILAEVSESLGLPLEATRLAERYFKRVAAAGGGGLGTQAMAQAVGGGV